MFHPNFPLAELRPAPYNPRRISPVAIEALGASIKTLGPVKAIIARDDRTIVAGHQRTKAMLAAGITHAPVYVLGDISDADEVRFNQIHNSADIETGGCRISIKRPLEPGWTVADPREIEVISRSTKSSQLGEIFKLLTKFGEWGNAVADTTGRVLASPLYALACVHLKKPLRLAVVPKEKAVAVLRFLGKQYGEFSYAHLPEQMWAQTYAQMKRLRDTGKPKIMKSRCYETVVIPRINKSQRILDFGAGQMDYVKKLRAEGYNILGLEFYLRTPRSNALDVSRIHKHIDRLCESLEKHGRYDVVVCDSVINSVTSPEAETAVLASVNALCRPGGLIVFSGRSRDMIARLTERRRSSTGKTRDVWFLDANGITAMYQRGLWLYQKFHTLPQVRDLGAKYIGPSVEIVDYDSPLKSEIKASSFAVRGTKRVELTRDDVIAALKFEFNLPLPEGKRFGRSSDICRAFERAISLEKAA